MGKISKTLLFILLVSTALTNGVFARRERRDNKKGFRTGKQVQKNQHYKEVNPREAERERRRKENYRKFSSNKPPKKTETILKRASYTMLKMAIGAGIGIGVILLYQNPKVIGRLYNSATKLLRSWIK